MTSTSSPPRAGVPAVPDRWWFVVDVVVQAVLCGLAGLLAMVLGLASNAVVGHSFTVLSSGIALAAAILLALAAWLSANGQAVRIAFAVLVYEVFLLVEAVQLGPVMDRQLVGDLALIGVVVLGGLAVCRVDLVARTLVARTWTSAALIAGTVVIGCVFLTVEPATGGRQALDVGAAVATAIVGLALVHCGFRGGQARGGQARGGQARGGQARGGQALLRRVGLALLTITAAELLGFVQALPPGQPSVTASALGLAGVAMLLGAAVPFAVGALRTVWQALAESQDRLHAAETAMANHAVRDHEMRNLVAGLSGVERVLAAQEADADSPQGSRQLRAAARAELERLRRMLDTVNDTGRDVLGLGPPSTAAVVPLLSDLAILHGAAGSEIELNVTDDDLQALVPSECLAHIVTNLLVNCARHAPGARVRLTAGRQADRVVVEVTDDGPGLPPGVTTALLEPGTRGPSSSGTGLGLHISAELAGRYGGVIRLADPPAGGRGCTVVVELPAAAPRSRLREQMPV